MVISARVSERMRALKISQAELARRVGLSQQAVGKLVNGNSRSSAYLHVIARELSTTPAYLSGETDDPTASGPESPTLSFEQRELLALFDTLSSVDRAAVLQVTRSMATRDAPAPPRLHASRPALRAEDSSR